MPVAFTTELLDERDRIPYWVDVASKTYYAHGFSARSKDFTGRLTSGALDNLLLTICDCGPCSVTRSRHDTTSDDIDDYIMSIRLEGRSLFTQGERVVVMEPGKVLLHNTGKPLQMDFPEFTRSLHVTVPRDVMRPLIGELDALRVMSIEAAAVGLAVDFVRSLVDRLDKLYALALPRLASQVVDLMSLAIRSESGGGPLPTVRANALRRVKAEIEKRLSDPGLNPAIAASEAGMSVRYANALLAEEGTSLERYIQTRRLDRCRRALEDPLQSHRMIGEIAYAWGFSDHSHFTRRFREAFGMTPSDCRMQARPGAR
jgi:AraC family transcriptional activator of tynA and feaB